MFRIVPDSHKVYDRIDQFLAAILEDVVTAIGKTVDFGFRVGVEPGVQERLIEHEILFSPCNQARFVRE
jgi:hypothetical protein